MRLALIFMIIAATLAIVPKVFANSLCSTIYGGGQTCSVGSLVIQKSVVNPQTNTDVHDLGINDPPFHPGQTVIFHISIKNIGISTINSATVIDYFPQYLNFQSGPGIFEPNSDQLNFTINNLAPNTSQTFTIAATVVPAVDIPTNGQMVCVSNQANVATPDNQSSAQDSSQVCIQPTAGTTTNVSSIQPAASSTNPSIVNNNYPTSSSLTPTSPIIPPQMIQSPATGTSIYSLVTLLSLGISGVAIKKLALRKEKKHHVT